MFLQICYVSCMFLVVSATSLFASVAPWRDLFIVLLCLCMSHAFVFVLLTKCYIFGHNIPRVLFGLCFRYYASVNRTAVLVLYICQPVAVGGAWRSGYTGAPFEFCKFSCCWNIGLWQFGIALLVCTTRIKIHQMINLFSFMLLPTCMFACPTTNSAVIFFSSGKLFEKPSNNIEHNSWCSLQKWHTSKNFKVNFPTWCARNEKITNTAASQLHLCW